MALNKEFERYNTKIEIPVSVILETIFSTDNKDVETLSRWALKHGFVDLIEKEDGKYYQLQDDYEKQSFYTYLSKKERKQYEYEDYLIDQLQQKENIIKEVREILKYHLSNPSGTKNGWHIDIWNSEDISRLDKDLEILDKEK